MKIRLNNVQRTELAGKFHDRGSLDHTFEIEFQHAVGDNSGASTQIAINGLWLHRDGTWHDDPEPPSPRYVIKHKETESYFVRYKSGGEIWTEDKYGATWWAAADEPKCFIRTDEVLESVCEVEEIRREDT